MKKRITILPNNFGNRQKDLIIPPLAPATVEIDGMTVRQKLSFCGQLSEVFNYYNIKGMPDGQWTELINSDLSVFSARILEKDNSQFFIDFTSYDSAIKRGDNRCLDNLFLQNYFKSIFSVLLEINDWFLKSQKGFYKNEIHNYLTKEIEETGQFLLSDIYGIYFGYCETHSNFKNQGLKDFALLAKDWNFDPFPYLSADQVRYYGEMSHVMLDSKKVGELIFTFMNSILKEIDTIYKQSLLRNDITPHIGLLLTFLDLIKHAKNNLNNLTEAHLDFYYKDVLKLSSAAAKADNAFLSIVLAKGKSEVSLVKSTLFNAGNDQNNNPITFESIQNLDANEASILDYKTFYFNESDTNDRAGAFTESIKTFDKVDLPSWSLLRGSQLNAVKVDLGFAFSCPDLFLAEGERIINLTFLIENKSLEILNDRLNGGATIKEIVNDFNFQLTGPKGWIQPIILKAELIDESLEIDLMLGLADDSVIAYNSKTHGLGYETNWPLMKVSGGDHFYRLLSELSFTEFRIDTAAKGIKNLILENDQGKLKTGSVFMPFGSMPMPGTNWYIGNYELFVKPQSTVELSFQWNELPVDFATYYYNYYQEYIIDGIKIPSPFENNQFRAEVSVLDNNSWDIIAGLENLTLFTDSPDSNTLVARRNIQFNGGSLPYIPDLKPFAALKTEHITGFLKFDLTSPMEGFGSELYPQAIARVTMDNGLIMINKKNRNKNPDEVIFQPIPNKPYIPKIELVELSYQSKNAYPASLLNCEPMQWYHISFEGIEQISMDKDSIPFIQKYPDKSYAYLGFDKLMTNQTMNLLFSVVGSGTETISNNYQNINYEYLSNTGWSDLKISNDTTDGFQNTGIVTWSVSGDFDLGSSLGVGLSWVRIGSSDSEEILVDFIGTNGLKVYRNNIKPVSAIETIPKGTIQKLEIANAAVKNIIQPADSFGGRSAESRTEFLLNTALRLNDKNRMMSTVDYNKMLLAFMPDLYEVNTIPMVYLDPTKASVVKILVATWQDGNSVNPYLPETSPMAMRSIFNYVNELAPEGTTIEVANPSFRQLEVTCDFTMNDQESAGALGAVKLLNQQLKDFLSPWIVGNKIADKETVNSDHIYKFIKSRSYVESILQFKCVLLPVKKEDEKVGKDSVLVVGEKIPDSDKTEDVHLNASHSLKSDLKPWEMIISAENHQLKVQTKQGAVSSEKVNKVGKLMITN